MKHLTNQFLLFLFVQIIFSCSKDDNSVNTPINYPDKVYITKRDIIATTPNGINVINGGFGSALASNQSGVFYALTDRGPNLDGVNSDDKIFPKPDFVPQIGMFRLVDGKLQFEKVILLKDETGRNLTGLPNPIGFGGTGENCFDINGKKLDFDPKGIDPEGLVAMKDGTFWISDEYGPNIIHFDANGKAIEWINPFGTGIGGKKLPPVYKYRRPNRGMEGLTITPDGRYLVGIMQSPLLNPNKDVKKTSTACRILFYEFSTGNFQEYIYLLDTTATAISEIVALTNKTFLVLERDGKTPGLDQNIRKKLYRIDITNATNVYSKDENGMMFNNKTIEQLSPSEIQSFIKCVSKEEVYDIMSIPNYPHDKPEGLVVINSTTIALVNDDDFGITSDKGNPLPKNMPLLNNKQDENIIYFIKLSKPLY